jgi:hypothetical protein
MGVLKGEQKCKFTLNGSVSAYQDEMFMVLNMASRQPPRHTVLNVPATQCSSCGQNPGHTRSDWCVSSILTRKCDMTLLKYNTNGYDSPLTSVTAIHDDGQLVGWVAKSHATREYVSYRRGSDGEPILWAWGSKDKKTGIAVLQEPQMKKSRFS